MTCACGVGDSLEVCCGPYLRGESAPETAEALMRSRYTAYTLEEIDYVLSTHDPERRDEVDRDSAAKWAAEAEWLGLEILSTEKGGPEDESGKVEFIARYKMEGGEYAHHEHAEFRKRDGTWYFVDGQIAKQKPARRETPKVGRNEPCPCGSGRKYKKCCG